MLSHRQPDAAPVHYPVTVMGPPPGPTAHDGSAAPGNLPRSSGVAVSGAAPRPSSPNHRQPLDPGLQRLRGSLWRVLRWIPYQERDLRHDVEANGIAAYLEARNRGQSEDQAIDAGVKAADRARRPAGTRAKVVRFVSDGLPAIQREAEIAGATFQPSHDWTADGVLGELPEKERAVARLVWIEGMSQFEAAAALGISRHAVRTRLERAKTIAADVMRRPLRQAVAPTIRRKGAEA